VKTPAQETLLATRAEFCDAPVTVAGKTLTPDATKGYVIFEICHAFPSVTAYGTCLHPAVIARCAGTMQDQVFNLGHRMAAYLSKEQKAKLDPKDQRDWMLGSIVAVEFPEAPEGGWKFTTSDPPCIRAAAVVHKQAQAAQLVEQNGGKWSVSQEINYRLEDSGFLILEPGKLPAELLAEVNAGTPADINAAGYGYVPFADADPTLQECYNPEKRRVDKAWQGSKVALMKGGTAGDVHWMGVGYVRVPAEREAGIVEILMSDSEAEAALALFRALQESSERLLTSIAESAETRP
jgi:hypothetical protein